ncbi:carboxypeptidase regulatory-like domain-containing protein [Sulfurimonas sp.]|nr:carboxypeptidase regulatory-like domain-containing protein [Sulfurimonas sp.]
MKIFTLLSAFLSSLFFLSCGSSDSSYYYNPGTPTTYMQGVVRHQVTNNLLADVNVTINTTPPISMITDASGEYNATLSKNTTFLLTYTYTKTDENLTSSQYTLNTTNANEQTLETVFLSPASDGLANGTVTDSSSGLYLEDVNVSLRIGTNNITGIVQYSTLTDASGYFSFTNIAANTYTVQLTTHAYNEKFASDFTVLGGQVNTHDYQLDLTPNLTGDQNISGYIDNSATSLPISGASVTLRANSTSGPLLTTITTDVNGFYEFTDATDGTYGIVATETGYVAGYTTTTVNNAFSTDNNISLSYVGDGDINGTVKDATDLATLDDVLISVHDTNQTGAIVASVTTSGGGNYAFNNLTVGNYVLELTKTGYITSFEDVNMTIGATLSEDYLISPNLTGDARAILEWGTSFDLDTHWKILDGGTVDHVDYTNKISPSYATLDVDNTSTGPETLTIDTYSSGDYVYYIYDFYSTAPTLASTTATVKLYKNDGTSQIITMDTAGGTTERYWEVFRVTDGVVTIVNQLVATEPSNP